MFVWTVATGLAQEKENVQENKTQESIEIIQAFVSFSGLDPNEFTRTLSPELEWTTCCIPTNPYSGEEISETLYSDPVSATREFWNPKPTDAPPLSPEIIRSIICSKPWPCQEAIAVATCESHHIPKVVSKDKEYYGLFQVSEDWWRPFFGEEKWKRVLKTTMNVEMAYVIYLRNGKTWSGAWPYCGLF